MTVGVAVSKAILTGLAEFEELDSSMDRLAMGLAPVEGAKEAGIPVGGCCFFLIISL